MKWKGDPKTEEKYKHDYRWIKNPKERRKWIKDHYELTDKEKDKQDFSNFELLLLLPVTFIQYIWALIKWKLEKLREFHIPIPKKLARYLMRKFPRKEPKGFKDLTGEDIFSILFISICIYYFNTMLRILLNNNLIINFIYFPVGFVFLFLLLIKIGMITITKKDIKK